MKEITGYDVANAIMNSDTVAFEDCYGEERGNVLYYAHIKVVDGEVEFVESYDDADATFTEKADISEWADDENPARLSEEFETTENEDFMWVCKFLAFQINDWLKENEF